MNNVTRYFHTVQKYREGLETINAKYDCELEKKKGYAGSAGYVKDVETIGQKRAAEIKALRIECGDAFGRCIRSMEENAKSRPATPPTVEQLNIIQLLKMKESVSRDELTAAARSMGECGLALSILEEIARAHDIMGFNAGGNIVSDRFVKDAISAFSKSARITLSLDRVNQRRQLMETGGMGDGQFGTIPVMGNIGKFKLDIEPENAQDCAARWGGVPSDAYEAFCKAVDGEG